MGRCLWQIGPFQSGIAMGALQLYRHGFLQQAHAFLNHGLSSFRKRTCRDVLLHPHLIPLATKQMWNQHFLWLGCGSKFIRTGAISSMFMVSAGLAFAPWMAFFEVYLKLESPLICNKCLWWNICSFGLTNILWFKPLNRYYFSICFSFKKLCHIGWFIHIWLEISL